MTLKYRNEFQDYVNQYELVNHQSYAAGRNRYLASLLIPAGFAVLGMIAAYPSNIYLLCVIAAGLGMYLAAALPYKTQYLRHLEAALLPIPERDIELEIGENGFLERIEDIKSFCPWSSMANYCLFRETLFVELKANVWAIIPSRSLSPDSPKLDDVVRVLDAKGIGKKTDTP